MRTAASETQPAPSPHAPNNPLLRWQTPTDKESLAATQALEKIIGDAVSHARRNGATPAGLRMLVLDWSGSLTCDEHLTAAVAYILTARECGLPCGASVFADRALTMNPTDDYDALLDWLFDTTMKQRAGGGNSIPGLAGLENNCAPGTCVMYLTDFNFYTRDQKADIAALKALTEFRKVTLETIVLGTEWAPGDELGLLPAPSNICLTLEELIRNSIRICLHPGSR